ncbi:hypothetical protein [Rubrolithibacter danxiaensis]|uniref:hypothetical protein n=1 Tax=Rubrolithibacter danxiaensis TaxID=3390805 RepID=UPI003BF8D824
MKSKKITYILIVSVAAIWGIIFYRIFLAANKDDDNLEHLSETVSLASEPLENYDEQDTFKLALNYRDPFLGTTAKDTLTVMPVINPSTSAPVSVTAPSINWDIIKYTGFIINPSTKKRVALVRINEREKMLSEGDRSEGVKLLRNLKDSIQISYQGKTKYIVLK